MELLAKEGLNCLPESLRKNQEAMAEIIENNLRRVIIEKSLANPAYYEKMSTLLKEIIQLRKEATKEYQE